MFASAALRVKTGPLRLVEKSKLVSKILRHRPHMAGLTLDDNGWAPIDALLAGIAKLGVSLSHEELLEIVDTNNKRRFRISDDGLRIRASQGHTVEVDLGYRPAEPPELLYHGTAEKNLASIQAEGLDRMRRTHVHLSEDPKTARDVGMRYGKPIVLKIQARRMYEDGREFFLADNGVWLTDAVPWAYIFVGGAAE